MKGWHLVKTAPLGLGLLFALSVRWWANPYELSVAAQAMEYVIIGLGLNLIFGLTGRVSFGHSGFFGIGAYGLVLTQTEWGASPFVAIVLALGAAVVVGAAIGFPLLRLRGHYLALGTMTFGFVVLQLVQKFSDVTGGSDGLRVPPASVFGVDYRDSAYTVFVVVAFLALYASNQLLASRFGRALVAIREDEDAARSLGIPVQRYVLTAFASSAVLLATAGIIHSYSFGVIAPELIDIRLNIIMLVIVMVGGLGNNYGVAVAGILLALAPHVLISFDERETLYYGGALLVILVVAPWGLGEIVRDLVHMRYGWLRRAVDWKNRGTILEGDRERGGL